MCEHALQYFYQPGSLGSWGKVLLEPVPRVTLQGQPPIPRVSLQGNPPLSKVTLTLPTVLRPWG